jgi:serine/threonine-protein kinase
MLERTDDAASALQRALEIEPSATLYSNLGTLRFFQGRYSDAAAAFEKAVELNATYFLYWANLGDAYRLVPGRREKAAEAYGTAIRLVQERIKKTPGDPDLQTQLALYLARSGNSPEADAQLQHWTAMPKKTPASYFRALIVHELGGRRAAALTALADALKAGYTIKEIREEPDLANLRSDSRYHRIVAPWETGGVP